MYINLALNTFKTNLKKPKKQKNKTKKTKQKITPKTMRNAFKAKRKPSVRVLKSTKLHILAPKYNPNFKSIP